MTASTTNPGRRCGADLEFTAELAPDGYRWWYVDALSDDGQFGLTIIAFLGSVFSPYYAAARRRGPADPLDHCALNVALYGRTQRWAMTERGRNQLQRSADRLRIGPSALHWDGKALTIQIEERCFPRLSRLRGEVRVESEWLHEHRYALDAAQRHHWWPIAPQARVTAAFTAPELRWSGHGYFDSNYGAEPLEAGFRDWTWSRATSPQHTTVLYDALRRDDSELSLALRFAAGAPAQQHTPPPPTALPNSAWGLARSTRAAPGEQARIAASMEDGPFYSRAMLELSGADGRAQAVHESLSLRRFSSRWVQCLLPFRMPRRGG